MNPAVPDARETARLNWARAVTTNPALELHRASVDAGFRSYWRGNGLDGTVIVMDSPPELEDPKPWLRIRDVLEAAGVRVRGVLARDVEAGFLLLEDLGVDTYLHVINPDNADALFDDAVTQLLKIQAMECPADIPP